MTILIHRVLRMIMLNEIMRVNMSYKPEGPVE